MTKVNTLEKLAAWLVFSLSVLVVYGFLALFLIGPSHATGPIPGPDPYGWIDSLNMREQPTFSKRGVEYAQATYDTPAPWILWVKIGSRPVEAKNAGNFDTKEQCKYIAKLVIRDIRKTDKTSKLEVKCELQFRE